jgi:chromosome segregation ATPase
VAELQKAQQAHDEAFAKLTAERDALLDDKTAAAAVRKELETLVATVISERDETERNRAALARELETLRQATDRKISDLEQQAEALQKTLAAHEAEFVEARRQHSATLTSLTESATLSSSRRMSKQHNSPPCATQAKARSPLSRRSGMVFGSRSNLWRRNSRLHVACTRRKRRSFRDNSPLHAPSKRRFEIS